MVFGVDKWERRCIIEVCPKRNDVEGGILLSLNLRRIRAERIASGMTQDEVAEAMGWKSRTPYAKRENGLVDIGANELIRLAEIFGYSSGELHIFFEDNVPE